MLIKPLLASAFHFGRTGRNSKEKRQHDWKNALHLLFLLYLLGNAVVTMSFRLVYSAFVAFTFRRSLLAVAASTCRTSNTALKVSNT